MYTNAELFIMATEQPKEIFTNNVILSVPDNAGGCLNLDAEKARLASIWDAAHMTVRQMAQAVGMSQTAFAKKAGIPMRTVQNWCLGERECPVYVRFLLAEHYGLI